MDIKPVDVSSCRPGECANLRFAPNAGALGEIEDLAPGQRLPVLKVWRREGTLVFAAPGTQAFTFSADGMLVVARQATEPPVNIWRVADGALLKSISPGLIPGPLALSPDNARLAVAGAGRVQVWRWGEGALEREWTAEANSLAFNADGTLLAIGGVGSVRLLSIADGRELLSFSVLGGNGQLALSPDGRRLAVVAGERVEIWGVPGN
jgi:WD40 repeat protein